MRGGRKRTRQQQTTRDWLAESITLRKGLTGAKPKEFCYWVFDVLNLQPRDSLADLFPGTGIVTECLTDYLSRDSVQRQPLFVFDERSEITSEDAAKRGFKVPNSGARNVGDVSPQADEKEI